MDTLKEYLSREIFAGNTLKELLLFFAALVATFAISRVIQAFFRGWLRRVAERTKNQLDDILLRTFEQPIYWIVLASGISVSLDLLILPEALQTLIGNVTTIVVVMFIAWSATNLISSLREVYVDPIVQRSASRLDDQIIPILEKSLKVTVWAFALLIAFDNIGFDVVSLLTGLGIGGLALAMAAKDTLANVFGSVTIFADRPFQVDDVITIKGHTGTVTELGLRTCRLRTFEGTQVTLPNSLMVGDVIENLSARTARKHSATLGLVYETTSEQLEAAIAAVKEILGAHPKVRPDFAVRFAAFGASSLDISMLYWVVPPGDFFDVVSEVNLAIKRRFDAEGWSFAFPSMTVYRGDVDAPQPAAVN